MKNVAIQLEETRLKDVKKIEEYPNVHERHRVFPTIFENRQHNRILDIAAGVGCAAQRIQRNYPTEIICNDITPTCLSILESQGLRTVSFDIDDCENPFPYPDGYFDAILSLATIEHVINLDHHLREIFRMISDNGYLYISSPNYAALYYFPRFVISGKTFHDPLSESSRQRYEFYAHVRYFTYRTLLNYVKSFGFIPDTVYLPLPRESTRYRELYTSSRFKARCFQLSMWIIYRFLSPRWATEPIICFQKSIERQDRKLVKVVL